MAVELPSSEAEVQTLLESAVSSRASHIRRESQTITMTNVRRLLESDLGLENLALDIHKAFIRHLVDEVLLSSDNIEAQEEEEEQKAVSEENLKKTSGSKGSKKSSGKKAREENGSVKDLQEEDVHGEAPKIKKQKEKKRRVSSKEDDEDGGGSNAEMSEEEEAPKKKQRKEKEMSHSREVDEDESGSHAVMSEEEAPKKKQRKERKEKETSHSKEVDEDESGSHAVMSEEEEAPKKKQQKERKKKETSHNKEVDEDESGNHAVMSEEDSDVSEVKKAKKVSPKVTSVKPTQNKKIEHLKKIIKACGLTIPPQIYKRAKQQPDDKLDKFLIKELEDILSRRGLSSNPSDKEIKAAKQKIAREKDLEGIDTTNIILEPRGRRATSQLFAPVYNPPPVEYDSEGDGDEESEDGAEGSEGSEDEEKDSAMAEDPEDSD